MALRGRFSGIFEAPSCSSSGFERSRGGAFVESRCFAIGGRGLRLRQQSGVRGFQHLLKSSRSVRKSGPLVSSALASASQPSVSPRNAEKTIQLPIDYYQVLGAESHFSYEAIIRAYESRVSNPPTEGFSQEVLRTRQQILKVARDTLSDRDLRDEYDNGLKEDEAGTLVVDVPWSKIPGALCLLQEVGEAEVVLQAGESLLHEHAKKQFSHDVALAMALAYVELSREAMGETPPAVIRSCDLLNAALKLLQDKANLQQASGLREQIYETLEMITPRCVLELLSLPLDDEHKSQRAEGLAEARNILWTAGDGGVNAPIGPFSREEFMKEALSRMTASEQVALFTETPSNIPAEKLEVYSVALAHVAEGFNNRKPELIREASDLFTQLYESVEHKIVENLVTDEQRDIILGRALTSLLLGEVESCRLHLGLSERSPIRCPEVVDFVYANSEENEDKELLSGICKLLESWLVEEVFGNFRESEGLPMALSDYFDDPVVLAFLENLEKGGTMASPLEAAAAISRMGAALDSVKTTIEKVFPLRKEEGRRSRESVAEDSGDDEQSIVSYGDAESGKMSSGVARLALQLACVAALLGGIAFAGLQQFPRGGKSFRGVFPFVSTFTSARGNGERKEMVRMDARLAEKLIRKWQGVKSQALGLNHSVARLSEILDGQMLRSWSDRAVEIARQGWYWEYNLLGLTIDSVTISQDGRRAIVEATLDESARLFSPGNPDDNDSYRSSYTTRYDFQYREPSGWKITGGALLRS